MARARAPQKPHTVHETELHRAERHVYDGEKRVARQRQIVDELRDDGLAYGVADNLLTLYETALLLRIRHLERILRARDERLARD